jgi:hypothetical protein
MTPWYGNPNHVISFLNIWNMACVKYLQTYSKSDNCYFVGYPKLLGISPPQYQGKSFLPQKRYTLKRIVLTKGEWENSATR